MRALVLKAIYLGLPAVLVVLSIAALNSGQILKRPLTGSDDFHGELEIVVNHALAERWLEAEASVDRVERAWAQVKPRVTFTSAAELIADIDLELAELRAAIEDEDTGDVRVRKRRLDVLWRLVGG